MQEFFEAHTTIGFCGSRGAQFAHEIQRTIRAWRSSPARLIVGCCTGADGAVIRAAMATGAAKDRIDIYAAFGPGAEGATPASDWGSVYAANLLGFTVHWWVGGGPVMPAKARLVNRSLAVVEDCRALVAFISGPPPKAIRGQGPWPRSGGSGAWSTAGAAALWGKPVVVCPIDGWTPPVDQLPALPTANGGQWQVGPLPNSWQWAPAPDLFSK